MKKLYLLLLWALSGNLYAQTWTGAANTDWGNAGNWLPAGVPGANANVLIPGSVASNNWPVLSANVVINGLDMQPGSNLDVNGYNCTLNGINTNININGAVINNSNNATDISFHINTGSGGFLTYFSGNTVNDDIIFTLSGTNQFIESVAYPANIYQGNAIFNINDALPVWISYGAPAQFNGNLSVNRLASGPTSFFYSGGSVAGDFSYTNTYGGATGIGNPGIKTSVMGKINVSIDNPASAAFEMYWLVNQTNGGAISVNNSIGFSLQKDTLLVNTLNIIGYRGSEYARLIQNYITGNLNIADDASYSGGYATYIRNNKIIGNSSFQVNGSNNFLEGDAVGTGNMYMGNVAFSSSNASIFIALADTLQCTGDVSITRTGSGLTSAFFAGANILGNLNVSNNYSGNTYLGSMNNKTNIGGTLQIQALYSSPSVFEMYRLVNQTNGGSVYVQNSTGFNIQHDTLLLSSFTITGYGGMEYGRLLNNDITADVSIESEPGYTNGYATYIRNNKFTGEVSFTIYGGNTFYEADAPGSGNRYHGNLSINAVGQGSVFLALSDSLWCGGNLSINRTVAGATGAFNAGSTILGNFNYSNNSSGSTSFGHLNNKTHILGGINIQAMYTVPDLFIMHRLINQSNNGNITIQNSLGFDFQNDTLNIGSLSITNYGGNGYARLLFNEITGNVITESDPAYSTGFGTFIRNNVFLGNCSFTNRGANALYEADVSGSGNKYHGNAAFYGSGIGDLYIAYSDSLWCSGNMSIIRTTAGGTFAFNSGGTINGNFNYSNNTAGNTSFGNLNVKTSIYGTIDINAIYTVPNVFVMRRIINIISGGNIIVQNSAGFEIEYDSIKVNSMSVTGYTGNEYGRLLNNDITGNVTLSDDIAYTGGYITYIRGNTINGNTEFIINGSNAFLDADLPGSGNKYQGNLYYVRNGTGLIYAGLNDFNDVYGNLLLQSSANITLGKFRFIGPNSIIEQTGIQPLSINEVLIQKNAGASITLNDSLTINTQAIFMEGYVTSSTGKELLFADNSTYSGATDASFVNGPVIKTGDDAFTFPTGKNNKLALISISAPSVNTDQFKAEYFYSIPHNSGYDSTLTDPGIDHISDNEFWMLERTTGASNVFVTLSWDQNRSGIVNQVADLRVARWNGSIWKDEGNSAVSGNNGTGTITTAGAVSAYSPFTLASSSYFNPLPLTLIRFTAIKSNQEVKLQWITENDISISHYQVERSADQTHYTPVAHITSKRETGQALYSIYDNPGLGGIIYYRLNIFESTGSNYYSQVIKINMDKNDMVSIYPNPASDYFILTGADAYSRIQVIDAMGRMIRQMNKSSNNQYYLHGLQKGTYYLRLVNNKETINIKLVIE